MEQTLEEEMIAYTFNQLNEKTVKVSHGHSADYRSREEIIDEAHNRVYSSLTSDSKSLLYADRRKNLDSNILASIKQRESEIDKAHSKMIANPNPKRGWVPFQNRLHDLRSRY